MWWGKVRACSLEEICVAWFCFVVIVWFKLPLRIERLGVSVVNGEQYFLTLRCALLSSSENSPASQDLPFRSTKSKLLLLTESIGCPRAT